MIVRRLFNTTMSLFIILSVFTLNKIHYPNVLRTNVEVNNTSNLTNTYIYLLDSNNLLVRVDISIDKDNIPSIIKYLKSNNTKTPTGLKGYLDKNLKVLDYKIDKGLLVLNLSNEFYNTSNMDIQVEGLVNSFINSDIDSISIKVGGVPLKGYNKILNKSIGINNIYMFNNRYNIKRSTVYYINRVGGVEYYTPITIYVNSTKGDIYSILDNIKVPRNKLISYINDKAKLIDYREEGNVMYLNFNEYLVDSNKDITNKILRCIAYSVFDIYDVNVVYFESNSKMVDYISRK